MNIKGFYEIIIDGKVVCKKENQILLGGIEYILEQLGGLHTGKRIDFYEVGDDDTPADRNQTGIIGSLVHSKTMTGGAGPFNPSPGVWYSTRQGSTWTNTGADITFKEICVYYDTTIAFSRMVPDTPLTVLNGGTLNVKYSLYLYN